MFLDLSDRQRSSCNRDPAHQHRAEKKTSRPKKSCGGEGDPFLREVA